MADLSTSASNAVWLLQLPGAVNATPLERNQYSLKSRVCFQNLKKKHILREQPSSGDVGKADVIVNKE